MLVLFCIFFFILTVLILQLTYKYFVIQPSDWLNLIFSTSILFLLTIILLNSPSNQLYKFVLWALLILLVSQNIPVELNFKDKILALFNIVNMWILNVYFVNFIPKILPFQWVASPLAYLGFINGIAFILFLCFSLRFLSSKPLLSFQSKHFAYALIMNALIGCGLVYFLPEFRLLPLIYRKWSGLRDNLPAILMWMIFGYLAYLLIKTVWKMRQLQKEKMISLKRYIREYEQLYEQVSTFKHDYQNILHSLNLSLNQNNLEEVKSIYYDVIAPTSKIVESQNSTVNQLKHIDSMAIKSTLYEKIIYAKSEGINISVFIHTQFDNKKDQTLPLIRALGILMDNAIEAAKQSEEKAILLTISSENNQTNFLIQNTYQPNENIKEYLFSTRKSTKKAQQGHGWGLYNLQQIIQQEGWFLTTSLDEKWVQQRLGIPTLSNK